MRLPRLIWKRLLETFFKPGALPWVHLAFLLLAGSGGCASPGHRTGDTPAADEADGLLAATPPTFLTGPAALLLTNANDYTARLSAVITNAGVVRISGVLFQQEGRLLFVPSNEGAPSENPWTGRFRFLWDTTRSEGFVISEALRGYARVSIPASLEGAAIEGKSGPLVTETIDGQVCLREEVQIRSPSQPASGFLAWRPNEGNGPPLLVQSAAPDGPGLRVELSAVNDDRLSPELFFPLGTLVRYSDPTDMIRELTRKPIVMPYSHTNDPYGRSSAR